MDLDWVSSERQCVPKSPMVFKLWLEIREGIQFQKGVVDHRTR